MGLTSGSGAQALWRYSFVCGYAKANMAVKRERFPIPTIDEVLQDLNESQVFIVCIIEHAL